MANYDDYKLEDAEDAAMKNSQMAKRAILGIGALGAVGAAAYAVSSTIGSDDNLTSDNLTEGMNAGSVTDDVLDSEPTSSPTPVVNHHHTNYHIDEVHVVVEEPIQNDDSGKEIVQEPEVKFTESTLIQDSETGEYIGGYDKGTIDGKDFAIVDNDGDGYADVMMYDVNGNKIIEEDEIMELDKDTEIPIGNAKDVAIVTSDELYGNDDSNDTIPQNDYYQEFDDLAHNNPDYNNNVQYADYHEAGSNSDSYITQATSENNVAYADEFVAPTEDYVAPADDYVAQAPADDFMAPADDFVAEESSFTADPIDTMSGDTFDTVDLV